MKTAQLFAAIIALGAPCLRAAVSEPIAVGFPSRGGVILSNPAAIAYGPDWAVSTNATGVTAELLVVSHLGENCVATQTLVSAASSVGAATLTPDTAGAFACRLILRTKSGSTTLGELVRDVSFGIVSAPSAPARIDTADDKLGRALVAGETPSLAYADWWTNNVASLRIDLSGQTRGGAVVQRELFSTNAPADGVFPWTSPMREKGNFEVSLRFLDSSNGVIDTLVAAYAGFADPGFVVVIR
jgi:hypothetical protein